MSNLILNACQLVMCLTLIAVTSGRRVLALNFYVNDASCVLKLNHIRRLKLNALINAKTGFNLHPAKGKS